MTLLEIRNYRLHPGIREHFIDYFESQLIAPQEDAGMQVLGQFRVTGQRDRFVWLRGFSDMDARLAALQAFYGGAAWAQHRTAANAMMLEWDNVHLLRPLHPDTDLTLGHTTATINADLAAGTIGIETGVVGIDFYRTLPGRRDALIDSLLPVHSDELRGVYVAEMAENAFTRLPVIQNADAVVVITTYASEAACLESRRAAADQLTQSMSALLTAAPDFLLLSPTLRSPLRYVE